MNIEINMFTDTKRICRMCQREVHKLIAFLKTLQRLKQEWQKNSPGTRQKLVWFGEI
jgi:hypothetical protein